MSKFRAYINETTNELVHKVSWPTWKELQGSAIVVMVASIIIAFIVMGMDLFFQYVLDLFYSL